MQEPNLGRAILAGIAAWAVFIIILYVAPLMGVPKMDLPGMLGGMFGLNSVAMGWVILFVTGIVFALLYAYWLVNHLPGPGWQRGLMYGLFPWLVMMVIVAPILPMLNPMVAKTPPGFFFVNMGMMAIVGSLAYLIWGIVLGGVYGDVAESRVNIALAIVTLLPVLVISILIVAQMTCPPFGGPVMMRMPPGDAEQHVPQ